MAQSRIVGPRRNENIQRTLVELEQARTEALALLDGAEGQYRLRVRAHLVYLESRLRWYRGRAAPKVYPEQQGYPEKKRRYARNTQSATEIQQVASPGPPVEPLDPKGVNRLNLAQSRLT